MGNVSRTPEQIAADNLAEEAIAKLLKAYNREASEKGTLLSYVIVAECVAIGDDGEICDEWTDCFNNPGCRYVVAKGLLQVGAETLETTEE